MHIVQRKGNRPTEVANLEYLAMGSAILFTYPEIATIAGLHGLLVYALCSAIPILAFAYLTPIIRKKAPDGFVLTEWVRQRYGPIAGLWLSFLTFVVLRLDVYAQCADRL